TAMMTSTTSSSTRVKPSSAAARRRCGRQDMLAVTSSFGAVAIPRRVIVEGGSHPARVMKRVVSNEPSSPPGWLPIEAPVELSEQTAATSLSVDTLLERVVELNASDLH